MMFPRCRLKKHDIGSVLNLAFIDMYFVVIIVMDIRDHCKRRGTIT